MRINYNRSGDERKRLVAKIAELTGEKPVYLKTPTYSYQIGPFNVGRYGMLTCENWADDSAKELAGQLAAAGFEGEVEESEETAAAAATPEQAGGSEAELETGEASKEPAEIATAAKTEPQGGSHEDPAEEPVSEETKAEAEDDGSAALSISLPDNLTDDAFVNLRKVVASKQTLMKHAFQSNGITVERKNGQIVFSGFTASDGNHTDAYMRYITLLTKFSKEAKRVTGKDYPVDNEKFAFRCFLIRIGMVGTEFKQARKVLLENLTGNSSWKNGAPEKAAAPAEEADETVTETEVAANA